MRIGVKVEDTLSDGLMKLPTAISRELQRRALIAAGEVIRDAAEPLAPRDDEAGAPHMADNIIVRARTDAEIERASDLLGDEVVVDVGPSLPHFYGYFGEFGTANEPARPWLRPAFDASVSRAERRAAMEIWTGLKAALHGGTTRSIGGRGL